MKMESCYIIAISSSSEESSVSLLVDGELVFSAMEKEYTAAPNGGFPGNAFQDCLLKNELEFLDIDFVIFLGKFGSITHRIVSAPEGDIFLLLYKNMRERKLVQKKFRDAFGLSSLTEIPPIFGIKQICSNKNAKIQSLLGKKLINSANAAYFFWQYYAGINRFSNAKRIQNAREFMDLEVV